MAYTKVWPEGWKDNEEGGTYINAAGLNKMEQGIVDAHVFMARTDNPNSVTKAQVGLGNAENTADINKNVNSAKTLTTSRTIDGISFNGGANITHYATCSTAAATTAKTATLTGFTLAAGARITVKFTVTNTGAVGSLTLNVNSTGAKPIKYRGGNLPSASTLAAGRVYTFLYDGTNYELEGDLDSNTTYTSKAAASGGTEVSLVTTGEKATWNAKTSNTGTITKVQANGTDVASSGVANIPAATTAKYGVTQLSSATNSTSEALAATPKAVKTAYDLANSKTSNTGTVTKISTGVGLTGGDITGTGTVKAKLKTETAHTLDSAAQTNTASRQYAVGVDKSGYLSVNVPWTNTTYTPASAAPLMDGTAAAVGTSMKYAREDHRHPVDTSRASAADLNALVNYIKSMDIYRTASGNPATFSDGYAADVRELVVTLTPTQSGSGAPYPPGARKNLFDVSAVDSTNEVEIVSYDFSAGSVITKSIVTAASYGNAGYQATLNAGTYVLSGSITSTNASATPRVLIANVSDGSTMAAITGIDASYSFNIPDTRKVSILIRTNQGQSVTTGDTVTASNLMLRLSNTDPTFEPCANIRPISGATSVSVRRYGKNLWGGEKMLADIRTAVPNTTVNGKTITYTGANASNKLLTPFTFRENTMYTIIVAFSTSNTDGGTNIRVDYTDGVKNQISSANLPDKSNGVIVLKTANGKTVKGIYGSQYSGWTTIDTARSGVFEGVLTADDFEPYQGQSVTVPLVDSNSEPLTVYGGTLNVATGELTVTRKQITLDGAESWVKLTNASGVFTSFSITVLDLSPNDATGNTYGDILCSHYPVSTATFQGRHSVDKCIAQIGNQIRIRDTSTADMSVGDFKVWLADNPIKVCYPLATPLTYQLAPAQLATLSGYNAVSSDAENVAVTYKADTTLLLGGG